MRRFVLVLLLAGCGPVNDTGGGGTIGGGFSRGIAYVSGGNIWVADASDFSTKTQKLTTDGNDGQPALSRDGKVVAYVHQGAGGASIFTVPSAGGTPSMLVPAGASSYGGLCWSVDDSALFFAADGAIDRVNQDGSGQITFSPAGMGQFSSPSVASDGSLFAFDAFTGAFAKLDGSGEQAMFNAPTAARGAIAPNGTALAYEDGNAHEIFVIDAPGGAARQLTSIPGSQQGSPAWSSDGSQIFFTSNAGGDTKIYVISASAMASSGTLVTAGGEPTFGG
jgi:TolB protein